MSKKSKLAILGPKGSYTELAAKSFSNYEKVFFDSITKVINAVKNGITEKGIVPIENSLQGTVVESLDGIKEYNLFVEQSIILSIHHCIAGLTKEAKITQILSHPQAFAQSKEYLAKHFPNTKLVKTLSTSDAFKKISEEKLSNSAAIGSTIAAKTYRLEIIDTKIEDKKNNKTQFFVISNERIINPKANKTFIVVYPDTEKQGVLFNMLKYFNDEKINLTKIESRPSRKKLGNYLFYVEIDGNSEDKHVKRAFDRIRKNVGTVQVLGSYSSTLST